MKTLKTKAVIALTAATFLVSCGGTEVVYVSETVPAADLQTTTVARTTTTKAPAETRPPASFDTPATNNYASGYDPEAYDTAIWSEANDFWWAFSTEELLNMGLTICQEFDRGQTIEQVAASLVLILMRNNLQYMSSAVATMTAAALIYLCPEHEWWLSTLN